GFVLASSPFAMIFAAPLAGRLAKGVSPHRIAVAGSAMSSLGLFGIALAGGHPALVWLIAAMGVQGFGVGLFQVAYFDIITGVIPPRNRGVAGALGMATRSIGTVTGATVLMLIFQILRAAGGEGGFTGAFQATFAVAGGINAMVTLVQVLGRRGTPRD
ncbi:MAG TPA: MFS transporter, partial [Rhodopila sp.]|nr:MFS transporter [Rhodopila sp.]